MQHKFKVEHLLLYKNSMYRVIGVGTHHLEVLEYSEECEKTTLSLVKDVWYKWVNGVGQKVELKQIGTIAANKVPSRVMSFNQHQLQGAETLIVKGAPYKVVEKPDGVEVPERWQLPSCQVMHLHGSKEDTMLCLQKMERTSLSDKEFSCHISNGGSLKESDIWVINVQR